jgi:putative transposase
MLIMVQFSRRIIGFAIYDSDLNGTAICHMFNSIISHKSLPKYLSSDNDPLFQFHQWQANLRILDIKEIKSVPYTPISHPFVERLIGTICHEFTDNILFWNKRDLSNKLREFKNYYNHQRVHSSQNMLPPLNSIAITDKIEKQVNDYYWQSYCRGLFQLPLAA